MRRRKADLAVRTLSETERHLTKNLKDLNPLRIDQIDRSRFAAEIKKVAAASGPVQANRTATSAHGLFEYLIGEGKITINPAAGLNKYPETPRDRCLLVAELAQVMTKLRLGDDYGDILALLILTGQRKTEIGSLSWDEVDLENATITLPPPRVKNRREHTFPLSTPSLRILQRRWDARSDDRQIVFGRGKESTGFSGWSRAKERLDAKLDLAPWCIHDLRRSFSTGLGDLGVPPHVIEMLLNHQSGTKDGVAGVYNLSIYEREGRQAVDLWAATVMAAVERRASTVVPLRVG